MSIDYDLRILAGIALDAESSDRYGLEDGSLADSLNALYQYLKYLQDERPPELAGIYSALPALIQLEQTIERIDEPVLNRLFDAIKALSDGEELLMPGGWKNHTDQHRMIYRFSKEGDSLLFSVFNAGPGLEFHEQHSSLENEKRYPIKFYRMRATDFFESVTYEGKKFLAQLILAQLPDDGERCIPTIDAKKMYDIIHVHMIFVKADPVHAAKYIPATTTTVGQLSKSPQRVIHQLLKCYFKDNSVGYRHFMVYFKSFYVKEFIKKYPSSCTNHLAELMHLAVVNTIKIAKEPQVFNSLAEQDTFINELVAVQKRFSIAPVLPNTDYTAPNIHHNIDLRHYSFKDAFQDCYFTEKQIQKTSLLLDALPARGLLSALSDLVSLCMNRLTDHPIWVLEQIQQVVMHLPLPEKPSLMQSYARIPFYDEAMRSPTTLEQITADIEQLLSLYASALDKIMDPFPLPQRLVTQMSLLALRDYFDVQESLSGAKPSFHQYIARPLKSFLNGFKHCSFVASNHPLLDLRLKKLQELYSNYFAISRPIPMRDHYNAILNKEPLLKQELQKCYQRLYGKDTSFLHRELRRLSYTELHYFFTNVYGEVNQTEYDFSPFIQRFNRQESLERMLCKAFFPFLDVQPNQRSSSSSHFYSINDRSIELHHDCYEILSEDIKFTRNMIGNNYTLEQQRTPAFKALLADYPQEHVYQYQPLKQSSHSIQLLANRRDYGHIINKDDFFERDLYHLRSSPAHQIDLTLDYFKRALDKLDDAVVQGYVGANLFEPGLLCAALTDDPEFLKRFNAFVQDGLFFYKNDSNLLSKSSIFFVYLRTMVSIYAARLQGNGMAYLPAERLYLSSCIQEHDDPAILSELHAYRFLVIVAQYELDPATVDSTILAQALDSFFYVKAKNNSARWQEKTLKFRWQVAEYHFNTLLASKTPDLIGDLLKPVLRNIGIDLPESIALQGKYPSYHVDCADVRYSVRVDLGVITTNRYYWSPVPLWLQDTLLIRRLGLSNQSSCFVSPIVEQVEFSSGENKVRILMDDYKSLTVQKEWTIKGVKNWYQLFPLTLHQARAFGISDSDIIDQRELPALWKDGATEVWVDSRGNKFIARQGHPLYLETTPGQFATCNNEGADTGSCLLVPNRANHQQWSQFENPHFISMYKETACERIYFARYGISLIKHNEQRHFFYGESNFKLMATADSPLRSDIAHLYFSDGKHHQCVIAVQQFFIPTGARDSGRYYAVQHDTAGLIANNNIKGIWHYEHSEQALTIAIIDGKPKPDRAADALYLCYIYLCTQQYDAAWAILDALEQRLCFAGNFEELRYLCWILESLPYPLYDNPHQKRTLESPRVLACKLKALAFFTDFLAQDRALQLPDATAFDENTANGQYQALSLQKVNDFYARRVQYFHDIYTKFQAIERHLPASFCVSDAARLSILNAYHSALPAPKAVGALGYAWRRLTLKTLLTRDYLLEAIAVDHPERQNIASSLAQYPPVMNKTTELQAVFIDLSLPNPPYDFVWSKNVFDLSQAGSREEALASLSSSFDFATFYRNFPRFLAIARGYNKEDKERLRLFCENLLKVQHHTRDHQQQNGIPYLANVLYRLLENPNACIPLHLYNLFDTLPRRAFEPFEVYKDNFFVFFIIMSVSSIILLCRLIIDLCLFIAHVLFNTEFHVPMSFAQLCVTLQLCPVNPIEVYEARDNVDEDILIGNAAIWEELKETNPKPQPIPLADDALSSETAQISMENFIHTHTTGKSYDSFCDAVDALQKVQATFQKRSYDYTNSATNEASPAERQALEEALGGAMHIYTLELRSVAENRLSDDTLRRDLKQEACNYRDRIQACLAVHWTNAITLANQVPQDESVARRFRIAAAADLRQPLQKAHLLNLYLHADQRLYSEKTGLLPEACGSLHVILHNVLSLLVKEQQMNRLIDALDKANLSKDPTTWHDIAMILLSKNLPKAQEDAVLMLFQYAENLLLQPRQMAVLSQLSSTANGQFMDGIEKVIPGGGKSTVVSPLAAAKKTTGLNLVVIEVPSALLPTNHMDLNAISQRSLQQKAHRFEFNRHSDRSAKRLEEIYWLFFNIMTHKGYIVTTGESIQSLQLSYIEILLDNSAAETWQKQFYWARRLVRLLKESSDVLIDEVHLGLMLKKKLNYTFGQRQALNPDLIAWSCALYQFLDTVTKEQGKSLKEGIKTQGLNDLIPELPDALIDHPDSPLAAPIQGMIAQFGHRIQDALRQYLHNSPDAKPVVAQIALQAPSIKDALAFYKQQLSLLLHTLARKNREHYGPSFDPTKSAQTRALAIPYSACNKPNERSCFADPMETINYTIQSMVQDGMSQTLLAEVLTQWKLTARQQLMMNPKQFRGIDQTPIAKDIQVFFDGSGLTLRTIHTDNQRDMQHLCAHFNQQPGFLFYVLQTIILTQLTDHPMILHSDAYNHVDIYHSCQGFSGTPFGVFHQRLAYNYQNALGTDAFILESLHHKKTVVLGYDLDNIADYFCQLFANKPDLCAILDIGALFTEYTNYEVAAALSAYVIAEKRPVIKYVLYYNDADILCALSIALNEVIVLGNSDPHEINRKLQCGPDERLTFYDQPRTVGANLVQPRYGRAAALINEKTDLKQFLQACMRMRGFNDQQKIDVIVPVRMQSLKLEQLIIIMTENQRRQLEEDYFVGALTKMHNRVREDLLQRLANFPDEDSAGIKNAANAFRRHLIETKEGSLFDLYGNLYYEEESRVVLERHLYMLLNDWQNCLVAINTPATDTQCKELQDSMQRIIDTSLPFCKPQIKAVIGATGSEVEIEVAVEIEKERLQEREILHERLNKKLDERRYYSWSYLDLFSLATFFSVSLPSLTDLCQQSTAAPFAFSAQLMTTTNYAWNYSDQTKILGPFLKPVHAILWRLLDNKLTAYLISNQELDEITALFEFWGVPSGMWISTTLHTILAGKQPESVLSRPDYYILMEQICFFNGELHTFLQQELPLFWINDQSDDKWAYFQAHIMPYRDTLLNDLQYVQDKLSSTSNGYDYLLQYAADDSLLQTSWETLFPDALPSEITVFKTLATVYQQIYRYFGSDSLSLDALCTKFLLSPSMITRIQSYVNDLLWQRLAASPTMDFASLQGMMRDYMGLMAEENALVAPNFFDRLKQNPNDEFTNRELHKLAIIATEVRIASYHLTAQWIKGRDAACGQDAERLLKLHADLHALIAPDHNTVLAARDQTMKTAHDLIKNCATNVAPSVVRSLENSMIGLSHGSLRAQTSLFFYKRESPHGMLQKMAKDILTISY